MKVAQNTALAVLLVLSTGSAVAGPQSLLDPYANIQVPTTARKAAKPPKANKAAPAASTRESSASAKEPTAGAKAPVAAAASSAQNNGGFIAGTREMFHGMSTAARGAASSVIHPAKGAGSFIATGARKVSEQTKSASGKVIDASGGASKALSAVPKKMSAGLKVTAEKMKDGAQAAGHALAVVPKSVSQGMKSTGEKLASGSSKVMEQSQSVGGKLAGTTKKMALAPLHLASRLNPFHHDAQAPVATASAPSVQK
jgi:hypothetical protein